ncbi:MAG: hypothetical protein V4497_11460 [Bacteroidota bacterium]
MKLTIEQITVIEDTLILNGLKFEDLKLEITDHIASEIEVLMKENALSFEENLKFVFKNWKIQLRPTYSFWFRYSKSTPYIVTNKCTKIVNRILLLSLITGTLTSFVFSLFMRYLQNEEVVFGLNNLLKFLSITGVILFIYAKYKIWKSIHLSTFGYLFDKSGFWQIFNLILIATGVFKFKVNTSIFDFHFIQTIFPITILCLSIFYLNLAYNHLQFNKKRTAFQ